MQAMAEYKMEFDSILSKFKYDPNRNKHSSKNSDKNDGNKFGKTKWKKKKQVIIKNVPRCYTHTGFEFNDIKVIEKLIVPVLNTTNYFNDGDIMKIDLIKIMRTRNNIPKNKIEHNLKITVKREWTLK